MLSLGRFFLIPPANFLQLLREVVMSEYPWSQNLCVEGHTIGINIRLPDKREHTSADQDKMV